MGAGALETVAVTCRRKTALVGAFLLVWFHPGAAEAAVLTTPEIACAKQLGRAALRVAKRNLRTLGKCRDQQASEGPGEPCPSPATLAKLADRRIAAAQRAARSCEGRCSLSASLACTASLDCPPAGAGGESCVGAKGSGAFERSHLGFPGPFCAAALGFPPQSAEDLADCATQLVEQTTVRVIDAVYGGAQGPPQLDPETAACLRALSSSLQKVIITRLKAARICREKIAKGKLLANPSDCPGAEERFAKKIAKAESRLAATAAKACSLSTVASLPACGGGDGVETPAEAAECFAELAAESVDSKEVPALRSFAPPSYVEAFFPPQPVCGDNVVNQGASAALPLGEECDGSDDSACPGQCAPPGDPFECTCSDLARLRFFTDASISEIDTGWTGLSHDQPLADQSGFIATLSDCDCPLIVGGECVQTPLDPICNLHAALGPRCSWDTAGQSACDAAGNNNGTNENIDCYRCDAFAANAGAWCANDNGCQSQCYRDDGSVAGACTRQDDCGPGETCRGRCDQTQFCHVVPNGGPLPVSAAGVAVCAVQTFSSDLTGTRDIVTGSHELFYRQVSKIHLGERTDRPCPVCGGFCVGGSKDLAVCKGRCASDASPCRFDTDCPVGDTCSETSPDCPGGHCELSLVCGADPAISGAIVGKPCRIDYEDPVFGTVSADCAPAPTLNISGGGLKIEYLPSTSGTAVLPASLPCTATGLELYSCPCPPAGGQPTAPNACAAACNAPGPSFGVGCADSGGLTLGEGTVCAGGANQGRLCDEDADCPGSTCNANPRHCVGDPALERVPCATNADCGLGLCVDACPGGRCVPLCVASLDDPTEGVCAAGPPVFHCSGELLSFRVCTQAASAAECEATCATAGTDCLSDADCPAGDKCTGPCELARDCEAGPDGVLGTSDDAPGAGICTVGQRECFTHPVTGIGLAAGLTVHDSTAAFCFGATLNSGINASAGFGGPVRIKLRGTNLLNTSSIP